MLEVFAYGIGVMYSPGPVNMIGFNEGLNGKFKSSIRFFAGVGAAMLILCVLLGYVGQVLVSESYLPFISIIGCSYILYLAFKILTAPKSSNTKSVNKVQLRFQDGFIVQVFNPKAMLALVPITTVQLPAAGVTGAAILPVALAIGILAMWAPGSYSYFGDIARHNAHIERYLWLINKITGWLLVIAAIAMFYGNVYLPVLQHTDMRDALLLTHLTAFVVGAGSAFSLWFLGMMSKKFPVHTRQTFLLRLFPLRYASYIGLIVQIASGFALAGPALGAFTQIPLFTLKLVAVLLIFVFGSLGVLEMRRVNSERLSGCFVRLRRYGNINIILGIVAAVCAVYTFH